MMIKDTENDLIRSFQSCNNMISSKKKKKEFEITNEEEEKKKEFEISNEEEEKKKGIWNY